MEISQREFIVRSLIAFAVVLLIGGGVYVYVQNKQVQFTQNTSSQATSTAQTASSVSPIINRINPSPASIGSKISIMGNNFDWIIPVDCHGNGCLSRPHIFVYLSGKTFKDAILFENGNYNNSKQVTVKIKSSLCTRSQINGMPCNSVKVIPGQYTVSVNVDGRGTSNSFPITITKSDTRIFSVNPTQISIGSTLIIKGINFSPLGGYIGNGWISNPHTELYIQNSSGKRAVLWAGNEPDDPKTTATSSITTTLSSHVCIYSYAVGGCPSYMTITRGKYLLIISVDGRGTSNSFPITITN